MQFQTPQVALQLRVPQEYIPGELSNRDASRDVQGRIKSRILSASGADAQPALFKRHLPVARRAVQVVLLISTGVFLKADHK